MKSLFKAQKSPTVAATVIAALALATTGATSAYHLRSNDAATEKTPSKSFDAPKGHAKFGGMFEKLNLSAAQRAEVEKTNRKMFESARPMFSDESLSCEAKYAKMAELKERHRAEMKKILTPSQQAELDEIVAEGFGKHGAKADKPAQPKL